MRWNESWVCKCETVGSSCVSRTWVEDRLCKGCESSACGRGGQFANALGADGLQTGADWSSAHMLADCMVEGWAYSTIHRWRLMTRGLRLSVPAHTRVRCELWGETKHEQHTPISRSNTATILHGDRCPNSGFYIDRDRCSRGFCARRVIYNPSNPSAQILCHTLYQPALL